MGEIANRRKGKVEVCLDNSVNQKLSIHSEKKLDDVSDRISFPCEEVTSPRNDTFGASLSASNLKLQAEGIIDGKQVMMKNDTKSHSIDGVSDTARGCNNNEESE